MEPHPLLVLDLALEVIAARDVEIGGLPNVGDRIVQVLNAAEEIMAVLDIAIHTSEPGNLYLQVFRSAELRSAPRTHRDIGFRGRHTSVIVAEVVVNLARHAIEPGELEG